jgi:hypothetical protein
MGNVEAVQKDRIYVAGIYDDIALCFDFEEEKHAREWKISHLKEKIQQRTGIPKDNMILCHCKREVQDTEWLGLYWHWQLELKIVNLPQFVQAVAHHWEESKKEDVSQEERQEESRQGAPLEGSQDVRQEESSRQQVDHPLHLESRNMTTTKEPTKTAI